MKEERLAILKMVEDGKINADDAVKLLDAISKNNKKENNDFDGKIKAFAKNMDELGRELGKKLDEVGKDIEPKIKKVAQTIIDKTNECASEIASAIKSEDCCCNEDEEKCCCSEENSNDKCDAEDAPKAN